MLTNQYPFPEPDKKQVSVGCRTPVNCPPVTPDNTPTKRLNLASVRKRLKGQGEEVRDHTLVHAPVFIPPPGGTQVGRVLGKCILIRLIGEGSWGQVFRAWHQSLDMTVAVKVLHPEVLRDYFPEAFSQLCREARLLARLRHPNIVHLFDLEDSRSCPYMVLECVEGVSLWDTIQFSGRLSPSRALSVITKTALGLQAARRVGVIHRDVKPANIVLESHGGVKLVDWGQATILEEAAAEICPALRTRQTGVKGTAAYMAPEQYTTPDQADHRADIYSLGATFYQAVVGNCPFYSSTAEEVIQQNLHEPVTPPHSLHPEIPRVVSEIIVRMLAKDPESRYSTYEELLLDLNNLMRPVEASSKDEE